MHASKSKGRRIAALISVGAIFAMMGCELIVDFDRTRIPVDQTDTGIPPEASIPDGTVQEASADAPVDSPVDAPSDANDAGSDADAADDAPDGD